MPLVPALGADCTGPGADVALVEDDPVAVAQLLNATHNTSTIHKGKITFFHAISSIRNLRDKKQRQFAVFFTVYPHKP